MEVATCRCKMEKEKDGMYMPLWEPLPIAVVTPYVFSMFIPLLLGNG